MSALDSVPTSASERSLDRPDGRFWALMLGAGLVAGLLAWLGGEATFDAIKPARQLINSKGMILSTSNRRDEAAAAVWNAVLAFSILGGAIGTSLGAAGGLVRGSGRQAASSAALGLVLGSVGGAVLAAALLWPYSLYRLTHPDEASRDMLFPLLIHAGIWGVAGALGGLVFGLGLSDRQGAIKAALGGASGAVMATVVFELVAALAFTETDMVRLISSHWYARLFGRLAIAQGAAIGSAAAVIRRPVVATNPSP